MSDPRDAGIPPEEVERRLEELRAIFKLGVALREVRFLDGADVVREEPPAQKSRTPPPSDPRGAD